MCPLIFCLFIRDMEVSVPEPSTTSTHQLQLFELLRFKPIQFTIQVNGCKKSLGYNKHGHFYQF